MGRLTFIDHKHGIPNVGNALATYARQNQGPRCVVGLVDKDKKFADVKSLRRFTEPCEARTGPDCRYGIYQDPAQPSQYLVVLEPACDTWLFEAAGAAGLVLADFGLPDTLPAFPSVAKDDEAEPAPRPKRLLQAIKKGQPGAYRELAAFVAKVMDTEGKLWKT